MFAACDIECGLASDHPQPDALDACARRSVWQSPFSTQTHERIKSPPKRLQNDGIINRRGLTIEDILEAMEMQQQIGSAPVTGGTSTANSCGTLNRQRRSANPIQGLSKEKKMSYKGRVSRLSVAISIFHPLSNAFSSYSILIVEITTNKYKRRCTVLLFPLDYQHPIGNTTYSHNGYMKDKEVKCP
jgi:hypothetical protein